MVRKNKFLIKKLKTVVFLGISKNFSDLRKINNSLNLNDLIVTTSNQKKLIDEKKEVYIFNDLNKKFKSFISKKVNINETLFISFGCRWIFKKNDISFFKNNLINFHPSRLPYDAGGGGFSWQILRNDRINIQLAHLIEPKIDGGKIIMHERSLFPSYCKIPYDFENYSYQKLLVFYEKFINKVKKGNSFDLFEQPNYLGRYNPRLNTKISGWINWNSSSEDIFRFINAFDDPYSGAKTFYNNKEVVIKKVQLHSGETPNHPFMSGLISRHDKNWLVVSTTDKNMLLIERILDKKGNNILKYLKNGNRFYTPIIKLDSAFKKKIKYGPKGLKK
jgi:methionyl-tRNA formyltransferase